MLIEEMTRI